MIQLRLLGESKLYARTEQALMEMFDDINGVLHKNNRVFDHLMVDGAQVYEDHFTYIKNKLTEVSVVEVAELSPREALLSGVSAVAEYISGALPLITELADSFYTDPGESAWEQLAALLEGVQWVHSAAGHIESGRDLFRSQESVSALGNCRSKLSEVVEQLQAALADQDHVLIADLLQYEVVSAYRELSDCASSLLSQEVLQ